MAQNSQKVPSKKKTKKFSTKQKTSNKKLPKKVKIVPKRYSDLCKTMALSFLNRTNEIR